MLPLVPVMTHTLFERQCDIYVCSIALTACFPASLIHLHSVSISP